MSEWVFLHVQLQVGVRGKGNLSSSRTSAFFHALGGNAPAGIPTARDQADGKHFGCVGLLLAGQPSTKRNIASCHARHQEHLICFALVLFPAESVGFGPRNISLGAKLGGLGAERAAAGGRRRLSSGTNANVTCGVDQQAQGRGLAPSASTAKRFTKDWHGGGEVKQLNQLWLGWLWHHGEPRSRRCVELLCRGVHGLRTAHLLL